MAYNVELMSIGCDLYPTLESAAANMNAVQREFRFYTTSQGQRQAGFSFRREKYETPEIWDFLRKHRQDFGGNRPYIIAFINVPLRSPTLSNLFGSHAADEGLAAVTLDGANQYVKEAKRYCCYYLVRYSLSFVNPSIKSHDDPARTKCYFHRKMFKPDIRASMDSGFLCDECRRRLDTPQPGAKANRLSADETAALQKMRDVVSGDYPYSIVMKGGGVKGLAFAAALLELQQHFYFDRHVGVSAGAIAAVMLAAGYTPAELVAELSRKNFKEFMDAKPWGVLLNLRNLGCFSGNHFVDWMSTKLRAKVEREGEIAMSDLNGAVIYATRRGPGTLTFDSAGARKDTVAAFASRCSMSIPLVFVPPTVDGRRVFDGGLRNNFPVSRFLEDHPGTPFIALYLRARSDSNKMWIGSELLDIVIEGDERAVVDKYKDSVVVIDTSPIGTIDFGLTPIEKEFLLKIGKAAALRFLQARHLDDGPEEAAVQQAAAEAEDLRRAVKKMRKRRTLRNLAMLAAIIAIAYFAMPPAWRLVSTAAAKFSHWLQ
jgi:predicted acylesterase/phospholipase RssA